MNDKDIRTSFIHYLNFFGKEYDKETDLLISEMGLSKGKNIVDLAVVNGLLHGYEIKSDVDTLLRLPNQIEMYEKYFSYLTIVTTNKHLKEIRTFTPKWIGLITAQRDENEIVFKSRRKPKLNKSVDKNMVVQLLWKEESLRILEIMQKDKGVRSKNKDVIADRLVQNIELKTLVKLIKEAFKIREDWQVVQPLM
jgi:hypothetical protein